MLRKLLHLLCVLVSSCVLGYSEHVPSRNVPFYIGPSSYVVETAFLTRVVVSSVSAVCRKTLVLRPRDSFPLDSPKVAVLVVNEDITEPEWEVLKQGHIIVMHLSTVYDSARTAFYPDASVVFRQYWTEEIDLRLPGNISFSTHVAWLPLGYGRFEVLPSLNGPLESRTNLWTWLGSEGMNRPARPRMLDGLRRAAADVVDSGKLHVFENFEGAERLLPTEYSSILYDSQFVPVPAGHSPEQYRIWEAFESGCIPIFLSGQMEDGSVLAPVRRLNFEYLEVDDWLNLPDLLKELLRYRQQHADMAKYQKMADENTKIWQHVKSKLTLHFAQSLNMIIDADNS